MMIAAGTVILLIDTYLSTMIIIKTATREIVIRRVIPGKDPLHLATAKTIGNGITTSKTTGKLENDTHPSLFNYIWYFWDRPISFS